MTEELTAVATAVRADAARVAARAPGLRTAADGVDGWAVGRARAAVRALFDTLAQAAAEAGSGLDRVGDQVTAAAGGYDGAERYLIRPR
ncbi:hypothetical protein AB2L27_18730 [Kineococcus sp. LSe6-4]|uniref:Excreted virulence factor EspC (Type VII ESX diderm) n=1 Tax=Kineococcus halophytocola TaxID=3234027 RepID=A0ABV4H666_9ACTN